MTIHGRTPSNQRWSMVLSKVRWHTWAYVLT